MAIKTINSTQPNERRPLQVSDLQDIWTALNDIFGGTYNYFSEDDADRQILKGFDIDGNIVTSGVYAQGGGLYLLTDDVSIGTDLYIHDVAGDYRTLENGDVIPFSFVKVLNAVADGGTFAFTATEEKILELKANAHGNESIPSSALMGGIQNSKISPSAGMCVGIRNQFFAPTPLADTVAYRVNIVHLVRWDILGTKNANISNIFMPVFLRNTLEIESLTIVTNPDFSVASSISGKSPAECEELFNANIPPTFVLTIQKDSYGDFEAKIETKVVVTGNSQIPGSSITNTLSYPLPTITSTTPSTSTTNPAYLAKRGVISALMSLVSTDQSNGVLLQSHAYIPVGVSPIIS